MTTESKNEQLTDMLANRLQKRAKHIRKWARRYGTDCFRLYDRDIPEIPLVVEQYGQHVVVYNYADTENKRQPKDWCPPIAEALGVEENSIFWKIRARQRGREQYSRLGHSERQFKVTERSYSFLINPRDYLDTGLFLDHRITRDLATQNVAGKRVLNLFAYTGSFSVYAAARGARLVTTIDLSNTYISWAKQNFEVNQLKVGQHEFIKADVLSWLTSQAGKRALYDVIILDPPTFSNSKSMHDSFEVERDQVELVEFCARFLTPEGQIWLSTNKRRFKLSETLEKQWSIVDVTQETQPEDFRKRPHQCWRLSKKEPHQ